MKDQKSKATNLNYLIQFSHGNDAFVKEMINLFLSENPEEIKSLKLGIGERDYKLIKTSAHRLRSTIPFVGLDKMIDREVSEIEKLAGANSGIEDIEKYFATIKFWCEKACFELHAT